MELIFEFLGELLFEGIIELIKNKRVPLGIRIFLLILFSAFYLGLIALLLSFGIKSWSNNIGLSIFLIIAGLLILGFYGLFMYKLKKGTLEE